MYMRENIDLQRPNSTGNMEQVAPSISAITLDCQSGITNLLAAATGDGCCARDSLHPRDVERMQDRFNQWAGNLGALESPESPLSLKHRLQNAPLVGQSILSSLRDLHSSIQAGKSPFTRAFSLLISQSDGNCPRKAPE